VLLPNSRRSTIFDILYSNRLLVALGLDDLDLSDAPESSRSLHKQTLSVQAR